MNQGYQFLLNHLAAKLHKYHMKWQIKSWISTFFHQIFGQKWFEFVPFVVFLFRFCPTQNWGGSVGPFFGGTIQQAVQFFNGIFHRGFLSWCQKSFGKSRKKNRQIRYKLFCYEIMYFDRVFPYHFKPDSFQAAKVTWFSFWIMTIL